MVKRRLGGASVRCGQPLWGLSSTEKSTACAQPAPALTPRVEPQRVALQAGACAHGVWEVLRLVAGEPLVAAGRVGGWVVGCQRSVRELGWVQRPCTRASMRTTVHHGSWVPAACGRQQQPARSKHSQRVVPVLAHALVARQRLDGLQGEGGRQGAAQVGKWGGRGRAQIQMRCREHELALSVGNSSEIRRKSVGNSSEIWQKSVRLPTVHRVFVRRCTINGTPTNGRLNEHTVWGGAWSLEHLSLPCSAPVPSPHPGAPPRPSPAHQLQQQQQRHRGQQMRHAVRPRVAQLAGQAAHARAHRQRGAVKLGAPAQRGRHACGARVQGG